MLLKKNIKAGKAKSVVYFIIFFNLFFLTIFEHLFAENLEGNNTDIKVLDKISSKNILVQLKNGQDFRHKDLIIKSFKCKNSEFDDNPEITAYIQVRDLTNKNKDDVYVFNGWMFSSSPSINPFDHPVYDIRLIRCY